MRCWGELKSLRTQRVVVRSVRTSHARNFMMCGNESQPGLQLVEKLTTPLQTFSLRMGSALKLLVSRYRNSL